MGTDKNMLEVINDMADKTAAAFDQPSSTPDDPIAYRDLCRKMEIHADEANNLGLRGLARMADGLEEMYRGIYFSLFKSPMP